MTEPGDAFREVLTQILSRRGHRVYASTDPAEALTLREAHKEPIDLLVTDMVMPGTTGVVLADRLRQRHSGMKVLLMSGHADQTIAIHGGTDTADAFLSKPFRTADFLGTIRRLLEASRTPFAQPPSLSGRWRPHMGAGARIDAAERVSAPAER